MDKNNMTPEREAQMRELFEADRKVGLQRCADGTYMSMFAQAEWESWLACARALEPMVREAIANELFEIANVVQGNGDDGQNGTWALGYKQSCIDIAHGLRTRANALKNAAMSAALEDGNA